MQEMFTKQPTPTLAYCDGWKGVQKYALDTLELALAESPCAIRNILLLVPTSASGYILERALEQHLLANRAATILPSIATMHTFLEDMTWRSFGKVTIIDPLLRQAIVEKALAETVASGVTPPFRVHLGLSRRILSLYDHMCLAGHTLETFAQAALQVCDVPDDAGAERMAQQTVFLVESMRRYSTHLASLHLDDPVTVHQSLLDHGIRSPYPHILILGADTVRPTDLAFLRSAPGVESIAIVIPNTMEKAVSLRSLARNNTLASTHATPSTVPHPILITPDDDHEIAFIARDREDVFIAITKLLKMLTQQGTLPEINRIAVIVPQPLPYLYLAKHVFGQAGIPYQLQDDFPLSAEPYIAAVDLIFDFVERAPDYATSVQLLRNPFFHFPNSSEAALIALEREFQSHTAIHGNEAWARIRKRPRQHPVQLGIPGLEAHNAASLIQDVLATIDTLEDRLTPLADPMTSITTKLACLLDFINHYQQASFPHDDASRHNRVKGALLTILRQLENVDRVLEASPVDLPTLRKTLRLAIQAHTFSERTGDDGIHIIDARSAGLGTFDLVILVGLNEGEWPSARERNIFYPAWLLQDFGWPSDSDALYAERIAFNELSRLATHYVAVFRHRLEEDTPTVASPFLEELDDLPTLPTDTFPALDMMSYVTSRNHALRSGLVQPNTIIQQRSTPGILEHSVSEIEPVSATAFELYLRCPFKYYAKYVLHIDEEDQAQTGFDPLQQGRIVHDILKAGFQQWDATTRLPRPVTEQNYEQAFSLFFHIAQEKIPRRHRAVELARLFGNHGHVGAIEWILRLELARPPLAQRRLEHSFRTTLTCTTGPYGEAPWHVEVKGRVDRVDIDMDGRIHVFDYKTGKAPEPNVTLQVPLYAMCLANDFSAEPHAATYLSLRDRKAVHRDDYEKAETTLRETYRLISDGRFPPRPYHDRLCNSCGYIGLCRKETDGAAPATDVRHGTTTS